MSDEPDHDLLKAARARIADAVQDYVRLMHHDDFVVLACVVSAESMEPATLDSGTYRITYTVPIESSTPAQCYGLALRTAQLIRDDFFSGTPDFDS